MKKYLKHLDLIGFAIMFFFAIDYWFLDIFSSLYIFWIGIIINAIGLLINKKWKTNSTMTNKAYLIISSLLILVILLAGRHFGYSFLERFIAVIIVGGLFELFYRKKLKKWKN